MHPWAAFTSSQPWSCHGSSGQGSFGGRPRLALSPYYHRHNLAFKSTSNDTEFQTRHSRHTRELPPSLHFKKSSIFSILLIICGMSLGPFLDSYHSAFGVLQYHSPISWQLWGGNDQYHPPALTTTWWVPPLFGLAAIIIGWMYILLDQWLDTKQESVSSPHPFHSFFSQMKPQFHTHFPLILSGIACFTFQYWLSGYLFANTWMNRWDIFVVMTLYAIVGYLILDRTYSGMITSIATAFGGPLIELFLIHYGHDYLWGYEYTDGGETGYFPLWILPVYFLGGPAVGNLARGIWRVLDDA
jgi:hypothetical protein